MPSKPKAAAKAAAKPAAKTPAKLAARHPYAYTLDLFALALDRLPPTFAVKRKKAYATALATFRKNPSLPYAEIQEAITALGKESWPYRKAYEQFYNQFGRSSEESFLFAHLDAGIREKYARFLKDGGKLQYLSGLRSIEEMHQPTPFERYFTPEEKFAIEQALLEARDSARTEIDELVTNRKTEEYAAAVEAFTDRQKRMMAQIEQLRNLAGVSKKWEAEMADRIKTIEEGWSVVEQGVDLEDLLQETEYWKGTLQSFLHA